MQVSCIYGSGVARCSGELFITRTTPGPSPLLRGSVDETFVSRKDEAALTVYLCRDCCCGTTRKHPEVDHEAQLASLRAAVAALPGAALRTTRCLDACQHSNLIVLRTIDGGRPRTLWLGEILAEADTAALCRWIEDGGPTQPLPPALLRRRVQPRQEANRCLLGGRLP
jgi:hypothetical protein